VPPASPPPNAEAPTSDAIAPPIQATPTPTRLLKPIRDWFATQGWKPLKFQRETWHAYLAGHSGMIQVPTGSGKTYAAVMGPIAEMVKEAEALAKVKATKAAKAAAKAAKSKTTKAKTEKKPAKKPSKTPKGSEIGLQLLYITPLRALSRDIEAAIRRPIEEMGWNLTVESRTGDTKQSIKTRQIKKMPDILITTPESLALLLSYKDSAKRFGKLRAVVLDEWHELLSSKRGTQAELCLSQLRQLKPELRTWAVSATLGNPEEAAEAAVGLATRGSSLASSQPVLIQSNLKRKTVITSILPESVDSFPWAGHLGLRMFESLVDALDIEISTLIFTNTRLQAERWYQALSFAVPEYMDRISLHHGSIDAKERGMIEEGVKRGEVKWVVCTSSLDLGVDFQPVERVVQIGSAKNLARLLQRAGRSAHVPEGTSEIFFLPTNALELLEISAFRQGLKAGDLEKRRPRHKPYDVLVQHLVTLACGDGFEPGQAFNAVCQTAAYRDLTRPEFDWIVEFIEKGGQSLKAYPRYRKVMLNEEGRYVISTAQLSRMHRMGIGTITSNRMLNIKYLKGGYIGGVEENFVSRLKPGDSFFFGGRQLEFVRLRDMVVYVRNTRKKSTATPSWGGSQLAISDRLSEHLRREVSTAQAGLANPKQLHSKELRCLKPILESQDRIAHLPKAHELLIETCKTREGQHLFVFPFEGRFVHEGIGFLWAYRFAKQTQATFSISVNDYGFEILGPKGYDFESLFTPEFFSQESLEDDIKAGLNISELTNRKFRGIAQVAGLVFKGYPSSKKTGAQLQISSQLIFEVFSKYEPDNLLLKQAEQEVLDEQLEVHRLAQTLERMEDLGLAWRNSDRPSPFAFPLLIERLNSRMSNESLLTRIERMKEQWDKR